MIRAIGNLNRPFIKKSYLRFEIQINVDYFHCFPKEFLYAYFTATSKYNYFFTLLTFLQPVHKNNC